MEKRHAREVQYIQTSSGCGFQLVEENIGMGRAFLAAIGEVGAGGTVLQGRAMVEEDRL
jgi:type II secretory pathway predicted ATPase ExeA